jgi:hypothetical protein
VKRFLLACLLGCLTTARLHAATLDEDVQSYIAVFNGPSAGHAEAVESLAWKGLSDPRLFDFIEQKLLQEYMQARMTRPDQIRVGHYVRALGFSGQPKYVPTLRKVQGEFVYQRLARVAQEDIPDYQRWNPIISDRAHFDPRYSDDVNRLLNMLRSDDLQLQRLAAKRVFFGTHDPVVLDLLEKDLRASYARVEHGNEDALSWMIKALGHADPQKYEPLFQEILSSSRDHKLRDYARRALDRRL